jgi:hypothetical protein
MNALPKSIRDNLRFLIVEVESQLSNLETYFAAAAPAMGQRILDRSGYAYNLKMRIHAGCLAHMSTRPRNVDALPTRAMESIATDLERISELCRECVRGLETVDRRDKLRLKSYRPLLRYAARGIHRIESAMNNHDTRRALKIGASKRRIDLNARKLSARNISALRGSKNTTDLVAALFVLHAIEQMGDALLNISEAVISANLGQPVNIERYHSLKDSVARLDLDDISVEPLAETRSGSGISGISAEGDDKYVAIFKDGEKRKLKEERQGVENWHEIYPGLAPKILSYRKRGQSASLLIEHLAGLTFEQILLGEPRPLLEQAFERLTGTLQSVWTETRTDKPVAARHMNQLEKRLDEVYAIHPEFKDDGMVICGHSIAPFAELVRKAKTVEKKISPPFSVYIHGDFNVDNIIFDPAEGRINFIDLHRSRYMDYVQDVSVFMVSNYRLQILDARLRGRILAVARNFHAFAASFAKKAGDRTFEIRLGLGLVRSFATSTRFILDESMAEAMYLRARFLIERIVEVDPKKAGKFRLPIEEIFVD